MILNKIITTFKHYVVTSVITNSYSIGDVSGKWYNELGSQMEIFQSADGGLKGVFMNSAPGSTDKDAESLIGSLGKGVPATLGFVVNFEVSLDMVTYYCSGFAVYACRSFSRKSSASTSLLVFFVCSSVLVLMHTLHSLFVVK